MPDLIHLVIKVSHGFPQNPSPLFRSTDYKIENRPGLEDQSIENVLHRLAEIDAYDVHESSQGGDRQKRKALARFLSDWHLVTFLGTTGLVSPVSPLTNHARKRSPLHVSARRMI